MTTGATEHYTREAFLKLTWPEQKEADLRKVFDNKEDDVNLTANCISVHHQDDSASMVIYSNGVYCFGCKERWWPDKFLAELRGSPIQFERGTRKQSAPKFIPLAIVETYRNWLWNMSWSTAAGHYAGRQGWLFGRGLSARVCEINSIGHTGEAFTIPIFGEDGSVKAIRYRRDDELASEDRPKYWGTPGANGAMLYVPYPTNVVGYDNSRYGVILCEGELDALRLAQDGYATASLTNGCNALKAEHVPQLRALVRSTGVERLTVCYDQDSAGAAGAEAAVKLLRSVDSIWSVDSLGWQLHAGKDVTEYLLRPNGPERFRNMIVNLWH